MGTIDRAVLQHGFRRSQCAAPPHAGVPPYL
nr:MAG TPA: hypothetical protein [Caudoviricetes sp.]